MELQNDHDPSGVEKGKRSVQLEDLVAGVLEIPLSALKDSSGPATLRAWSSLKHIQLVAVIESMYKTTFTASEVQRFTSVAAIRNILLQKGIALQ